MTRTYRILYDKPKYGDYVKGLALPIFIHNGSYYLSSLDVYSDGVAECWGLVPIPSLHEKVQRGRITTEPPIGGQISIHDLGFATVTDVEWQMSNTDILPVVQELFQRLNPTGQNLFDLDKRRKILAADWNIPEDSIGQTRLRSRYGLYRLGKSGEKIMGATLPLFWSSADHLTVTDCFIYADGWLSLGSEGELLSLDDFQTLFDTDQIHTSVKDDKWIELPGLGHFRATHGYWHVKKDELWKNILNCLNILRDQPDVVEVCYQAFLAYEENPTNENREALRIAYEAVPEHHRLYTQRDMDSKDHDIKRILYG